MAGKPADASGDPRAAGAGRGRSRRLASDRPAGAARLCPGTGRAHSPLTGAAVPATVSGRAPAGAGIRRQPAGRWQAPRSVRTVKNPGCPRRAVARRTGTGDRPADGAARQQSPLAALGALGPAGAVPQACRAWHGFVSQSASAAPASSPAAQAGDHTVHVTPAHTLRSQPGPGQSEVHSLSACWSSWSYSPAAIDSR